MSKSVEDLVEGFATDVEGSEIASVVILSDGDKVCHYYDGDDDKIVSAIIKAMEREPELERLIVQAIALKGF